MFSNPLVFVTLMVLFQRASAGMFHASDYSTEKGTVLLDQDSYLPSYKNGNFLYFHFWYSPRLCFSHAVYQFQVEFTDARTNDTCKFMINRSDNKTQISNTFNNNQNWNQFSVPPDQMDNIIISPEMGMYINESGYVYVRDLSKNTFNLKETLLQCPTSILNKPSLDIRVTESSPCRFGVVMAGPDDRYNSSTIKEESFEMFKEYYNKMYLMAPLFVISVLIIIFV